MLNNFVLLEIALTTLYLVPISFFRYIPFREKFRFSIKVTILLFFAFFTIGNLILVLSGRYDSFITANRFRPALYLCMTLFSFFLIKDNIAKQLYVICFYANYTYLFTAAALIPEALIHGNNSTNLAFKVMGMLIILVFAMPLIYHFGFRPLSAIVKRDIPKIWVGLCFSGLIQLFLNAMLSIPFTTENIMVDRNAIVRLTISIGSIFINHTILYLISAMLSANDEKMALAAEKQQLVIQEYQYRNIQDQIEYSRRFRHDFKHHGGLIVSIVGDSTLSEHDKLEKLTHYCTEYFNTIPSAEELHFCDHYSLNLLLNYYAGQATESGIYTSFKINVPASIPIKDTDLCVIVGNLLLNAIEGAQTAPDELKNINLNITKDGRNLLIIAENGFNGQISVTGDEFHSTKHSGPGIGINNIRDIAKRYDGNCYFEYEDKLFLVKIHLILKY